MRKWLLALADEQLREVLSPREIEALDFGLRERVTDLDQPHIRDLPKTLPAIFAAAARRAEAAGFDGVELHYAHAYTMASFLSARNTRDDGYGGPRENRVRLPLEVFRAVRGVVSDSFPVGCRYLSDDCLDGGNTVDDAVFFGVEFAQGGDGFSVAVARRQVRGRQAAEGRVGGLSRTPDRAGGNACPPSSRTRQDRSDATSSPPRAFVAAIRDAGLATPVIVAGGISTFDQAEAILASGAADIVGAARQSLADPDWFLKMRLGRGGEVRRCCFTNYCEGLDQMHKQVTCKLWDRERLDEPGISMSLDGRRRLLAPRN